MTIDNNQNINFIHIVQSRFRQTVSQTDRYLMGMSFMTSLNMDGEMTGSQSLGSKGSWPLSITFLSSNQRLKDSRGGSIPEPETQSERRPTHLHAVHGFLEGNITLQYSSTIHVTNKSQSKTSKS